MDLITFLPPIVASINSLNEKKDSLPSESKMVTQKIQTALRNVFNNYTSLVKQYKDLEGKIRSEDKVELVTFDTVIQEYTKIKAQEKHILDKYELVNQKLQGLCSLLNEEGFSSQSEEVQLSQPTNSDKLTVKREQSSSNMTRESSELSKEGSGLFTKERNKDDTRESISRDSNRDLSRGLSGDLSYSSRDGSHSNYYKTFNSDRHFNKTISDDKRSLSGEDRSDSRRDRREDSRGEPRKSYFDKEDRYNSRTSESVHSDGDNRMTSRKRSADQRYFLNDTDNYKRARNENSETASANNSSNNVRQSSFINVPSSFQPASEQVYDDEGVYIKSEKDLVTIVEKINRKKPGHRTVDIDLIRALNKKPILIDLNPYNVSQVRSRLNNLKGKLEFVVVKMKMKRGTAQEEIDKIKSELISNFSSCLSCSYYNWVVVGGKTVQSLKELVTFITASDILRCHYVTNVTIDVYHHMCDVAINMYKYCQNLGRIEYSDGLEKTLEEMRSFGLAREEFEKLIE